jgi:hypothetical protein
MLINSNISQSNEVAAEMHNVPVNEEEEELQNGV